MTVSSRGARSPMRALVLHAVADLRLDVVPRPEPAAGSALVRVGCCGVCGSDLPRIFTKGTYSFPRVCGHEFAGTVEAIGGDGEGVVAKAGAGASIAVGDRVAVFPLLWCGRCAACEVGKYVQCHDYDYLGSRSDGAFAEYVVAPLANLVRVPDGVSLEVAAMTEPAAVALHAVRQGGGTRPGESAAIFGSGPIGLMVAQWLRAMGASDVLLFDIDAPKLDVARRMAFPHVFDSRERDPVEVVRELTGGNGAHLTFDGAGVPPALIQALASARRGGRVVLLGNPSADVTLPTALISQLMRREVSIRGTWNSDYSACGNDDDWRTVLGAMADRTLDLEPLITHRVGLDAAIGLLEAMRDRREFYSKVLVRP